jgi:hypothetical protein
MVAMAAMAAMVAMYVWAHRHKQRGSRDPMTWPVLGAQLEAARNYGRLLDWITGFFDADHRTVTMRTLGRTSYLTVDPANIQHILKTNFSNYPKVCFASSLPPHASSPCIVVHHPSLVIHRSSFIAHRRHRR